MELTIIEYDMVQTYPSEIAASALCLANRLLDGSKWVRFNSIGSTLCLLSDKDSFKEVLQVELQRSYVGGKTFLAGRIYPGAFMIWLQKTMGKGLKLVRFLSRLGRNQKSLDLQEMH